MELSGEVQPMTSSRVRFTSWKLFGIDVSGLTLRSLLCTRRERAVLEAVEKMEEGELVAWAIGSGPRSALGRAELARRGIRFSQPRVASGTSKDYL